IMWIRMTGWGGCTSFMKTTGCIHSGWGAGYMFLSGIQKVGFMCHVINCNLLNILPCRRRSKLLIVLLLVWTTLYLHTGITAAIPSHEIPGEVIAVRFVQSYNTEAAENSLRFGIHGIAASRSEDMRTNAVDYGVILGLDRLHGLARSRDGAERTLAYMALL